MCVPSLGQIRLAGIGICRGEALSQFRAVLRQANRLGPWNKRRNLAWNRGSTSRMELSSGKLRGSKRSVNINASKATISLVVVSVELLVKVLVTEHNLFADLEASEESPKDTASPLRRGRCKVADQTTMKAGEEDGLELQAKRCAENKLADYGWCDAADVAGANRIILCGGDLTGNALQQAVQFTDGRNVVVVWQAKNCVDKYSKLRGDMQEPRQEKNGMITEGLVRCLSQMGTYRMSSWTSPVMCRSWSAAPGRDGSPGHFNERLKFWRNFIVRKEAGILGRRTWRWRPRMELCESTYRYILRRGSPFLVARLPVLPFPHPCSCDPWCLPRVFCFPSYFEVKLTPSLQLLYLRYVPVGTYLGRLVWYLKAGIYVHKTTPTDLELTHFARTLLHTRTRWQPRPRIWLGSRGDGSNSRVISARQGPIADGLP
ncbi:hypothetical protein CCUS01_09170 [Colletotrichum cuscutae]|uniref:Uncharacterized protein n=1 Tax=Colletotrichum cuscutae TaxID=1209917 RepID=A0AAI9UHV1_9PEZI|nr:hypothetical protein CCUS01_09170 [Colletotrichum cuscutae]